MILFVVVFLTVFYSLYVYAFAHLATLFGFKVSFLLLLLLSLSYPLTVLIDRWLHSWPTRFLYTVTSIWLGVLFLFCSALVVYDLLNLVVPLGQTGLAVVLLFVSALSIYALLNACGVIVKEVPLSGFGKKLTVAQLSDIHVGTIRNSRTLQKIVDRTNASHPDIVLITGDLVDGSGKLTTETFAPLKKLCAPTFMIMGNHEFYEGLALVERLVKKTGVKILRNEAVMSKGLCIIGMEYSAIRSYVAKKLPKLLHTKLPVILLNHEPVGYDAARKAGVKLMLSGHTHSGQIFPFTLLVRAFYPYISGLYTLGGLKFYVSPGTGTWGPPMRLGSRNEITLFKLS